MMRLPVRQPVRLGIFRGLVLWLKFDEGVGLKAYDLSQYRNHGTIHGATWVEGKFGKALSFDGVDDYVEIGSTQSLQITRPITFEGWIKPDTPTTKFGRIISFVADSQNLYEIAYRDEYYRLNVERKAQGDNTPVYTPTNSVPIGKWTHFTAVWDGSYWKIYLNGELKDSTSATTTPTGTFTLRIGAYTSDGYFFNGTIDEVRIYNRALSAEEIKRLYWQVIRVMRD